MKRTIDTDTCLRALDPASTMVDPANPRARADLARILATGRSAGETHHPKTRGRTTRKLILTGAVVTAAAVGVVAFPALIGGDQAFASWTGNPQTLTAAEQTAAAASCRSEQKESVDDSKALASARVAIAERRGVWTTVVFAGTKGFSAMCITDESTHLFTKDMIGSSGTPGNYTKPGPNDLIATDLGTGTMSAGDISLAAGFAGPDVIDVTYSSPTHGDVKATVSEGHFALWLPGNDLINASSTNPVDVEVTYRDGSTRTRSLKL